MDPLALLGTVIIFAIGWGLYRLYRGYQRTIAAAEERGRQQASRQERHGLAPLPGEQE